MKEIKLGKSGDLDQSATLSAVICLTLMAAALAVAGIYLLKLTVFEGIVGGITVTFLHFDSELFHQQGHASAARKAGYPMIGIRYWAILGTSIYPPDEPELPAEVHIQRALGGPRNSALMAAVAAVAAYVAYSSGGLGLIFYVFLFFCLDNLLFFTLGAFLPLGFTDGSTLLRWWPKRSKQA
jgi:hypothetical protein